MSQITADKGANDHTPDPAHVRARATIDPDAVSPPSGGAIGIGLMAVGALLSIVAIVLMFTSMRTDALTGYHAGVIYAITLALGSIGLVMILQQFNAGWSCVIRRQFENIGTGIVACAVLFLPIIFAADGLFQWMRPEVAGEYLYEWKKPFLDRGFWVVRSVVYFAVWIILAMRLFTLSREQDESGDVWLTGKARTMSSYGLLLFALTAAFAAFDWLMGLDYHWFSTMFGVYFFAGMMVSTVSFAVLILGVLKMTGKLDGIVTQEHFHDLGKLMLSFTVFWAYISFSQYFLIWYSNIPEETWFYQIRQLNGWKPVFVFLCFGHFLVPFTILLFRATKRHYQLLMAVAAWILIVHAVDLLFVILPTVDAKRADPTSGLAITVLTMLGPIILFVGVVVWRVCSSPLIPIKDPRLQEGLKHKNYV